MIKKRHIAFTEKKKKIVLRLNDDKRIQSIDLIETYAYGTNKNLLSEKENIKCNNILKGYTSD